MMQRIQNSYATSLTCAELTLCNVIEDKQGDLQSAEILPNSKIVPAPNFSSDVCK